MHDRHCLEIWSVDLWISSDWFLCIGSVGENFAADFQQGISGSEVDA
ncbi:hypothetical protein QWI18_05880 [Pseudomonas sp. W2Oct36]|nr:MULTISPECIES: hypothetical protein [Pseudomonas]MBD8600328.1 hypothetical protein [Pseudomonas sp. CFBP 8772]